MNKSSQPLVGFIFLLVMLAALSRLLPHPPNFTPITGMALAGAAYINRKAIAFILPVIALWIGDLVLNNTIYSSYFDGFYFLNADMLWIYVSIMLVVAFGMLILKKVNVKNVIGGALGGSAIFFLVSNFAVWATGATYPKTVTGLSACYAAAVPFLQNTVMGDLFYTAIIFGAVEVGRRYIPSFYSAS